MESREKDTVNRTFRLPREYDEALREEAEKLGTSINNVATRVMKKFTDSDRYFGRGQSIMLAPQTLINFLDEITEEEMSEAGTRSGSSVPKNRLLLKGMPLNRDSAIHYITSIIGGYDDWFTCDHYERKNYTQLHLRHVYNEKWSVFLEYYIRALFQSMLDIEGLEFERTPSTLTVKVPK